VDDETYLVSCTYEERRQECGYYFQVNLNVGVVTDIFADTPLTKRYEGCGIHPDWKMVLTPSPESRNIQYMEVRVAD
jgi:hypothetical protein